MDKYHHVLNALLDELDFLDAQMQSALAEGDYEQAHWFQEAKFFKRHALWGLENVFIPLQKRRFPPPDRFVVNNKPAGSVLADHLKGLLQKDSDILALQIRFQKTFVRSSMERISVYRNPLNQKINLILTKPDSHEFQLAILKHIGWRRDEEDGQRFICELGGKKKDLLQMVKLVIARTVFEVIDKYEMKTELRVIMVK